MAKVRNASDYELEYRPTDGSPVVVEKGHQMEVTAEVAKELVKQDLWAEVKATSSSDKKDDNGGSE